MRNFLVYYFKLEIEKTLYIYTLQFSEYIVPNNNNYLIPRDESDHLD